MFGDITGRFARKWQVNRDHSLLEPPEVVEKVPFKQREEDLSGLASQAYMHYARKCQEKEIVDDWWIEYDGGARFFIGLWSFSSTAGKRETRVEVTNLDVSDPKTYLVVFSQYARYTFDGWWADYQPPEKTSLSSPADATAGLEDISNSSLYHSLKRVVFSL